MPDLVSDSTSFSCPFCTSKLKLTVPSCVAKGQGKLLANTSNSFFPPPGGQCTVVPSAPTPCMPSVNVVDPGQTIIQVDGKTGLGSGCKFMCAKGGLLTVSSPGQPVAKHNEASEVPPSKWDKLDVALTVLSILPVGKLLKIGSKAFKAVSKVIKSGSKLFKKSSSASKIKGGAKNRVSFEKYKSELRSEMSKPHVTDPKLKKIVDKNYRDDAKIGSGSTAAAIRHERMTGEKVGGREHSQKGKETIKALEKWLKDTEKPASDKNPGASPGDRAAAENIIQDLKNALGE